MSAEAFHSKEICFFHLEVSEDSVLLFLSPALYHYANVSGAAVSNCNLRYNGYNRIWLPTKAIASSTYQLFCNDADSLDTAISHFGSRAYKS